jgi:hypothetical protein
VRQVTVWGYGLQVSTALEVAIASLSVNM